MRAAALRAATGGLVLAAVGCGVLPGPDLSRVGPAVRVGRAGLDVHVSVPGWRRPDVKIVLCASDVSGDALNDLIPSPAQRRDCLEMQTVHAGLELAGTYSFRSASATRFKAFDESREWWVVIVGLDQAAPRFVEVPVPGGPVEVE